MHRVYQIRFAVSSPNLWDTISPYAGCASHPESSAIQVGEAGLYLTTTGWFLSVQNWDRGHNCSEVRSSTNLTFYNDTFCLFTRTTIDYQPNAVYGYADGSARYVAVNDKDGTCFIPSVGKSLL
ncbi:MAG: hypothetical protein ACREXX_22390 [Gammaproteobacteria bacterium]